MIFAVKRSSFGSSKDLYNCLAKCILIHLLPPPLQKILRQLIQLCRYQREFLIQIQCLRSDLISSHIEHAVRSDILIRLRIQKNPGHIPGIILILILHVGKYLINIS